MPQPRGDLDVLGALAQDMFTPAGGELIPQPLAAYQQLRCERAIEPALVTSRPGQVLIGDKNYYGAAFAAARAAAGIRLLRPARKGEPEPAGTRFFKPLRQIFESVKTPSKGTWTWDAMAGTLHPGRDLTGHGSRIEPHCGRRLHGAGRPWDRGLSRSEAG
jgi:hypothetical protein